MFTSGSTRKSLRREASLATESAEDNFCAKVLKHFITGVIQGCQLSRNGGFKNWRIRYLYSFMNTATSYLNS